MNCGEIRPLISAYLDGEVTPEERKSVERHLATCEGCRQVLSEYRAIGSDLRAMPVPMPPVGLRRDVWRAIEAREGGARVVKTPPASHGKIIPLPQNRNKPSVINVLTGAGNGWARAIPAAVLVGALLIALSYFTIIRQTPVAVATMVEEGELTDYEEAVHVLLSKPVIEEDIESFTTVAEVTGGASVPVKVTNTYIGRTSSGELAIQPEGTWKPGARYRITIDAPRVRQSGIPQPLDSKPIDDLEFSTAMHTPTATSSPTNTPIPTDTPVPPTQTPEPPVVNTPASTAVAQVSPEVPVVGATDTPGQPAATATKQPNTPVPPTATRPAPTNTRAVPTATQVPPSATNTAVPSNTPVPPTTTSQPTQVPSATATVTASATATRKSTGTPTATSTVQPKVTASPTSGCLLEPVRGFGKVWREHSDVRERLGCPTIPEEGVLPAAQQHFQYGYMFWRGDTRTIYVFLRSGPRDQYGTWLEVKDTWVEGEPVPTVEGGAPDGGYIPVRGFGKIWASDPELRRMIGYATEPETSVGAVWQPFEHGMALWTSDRTIRMMYADGIWQHFNDTFTGE
ncbi:MAG: zf-HC2 domain-containing protein [Chloroflexota bacterium]|nr:zf-HC2 domain-containing protein [Chloroflexota bacterium]